MSAGADEGATDPGRRISEQRHQAGLSRGEAAARAGIDPGYLDYLEASSSPEPTHSAMVRLASAPRTSPSALAGAGRDTSIRIVASDVTKRRISADG